VLRRIHDHVGIGVLDDSAKKTGQQGGVFRNRLVADASHSRVVGEAWEETNPFHLIAQD
jgi:hypothetical protein